EIRSVRDEAVDAEAKQALCILFPIDRPYVDAESRAVRQFDEALRDDARRPRELRHLKSGVPGAAREPPDPRLVQRPAHLFARGAGGDRRRQPARRVEHTQAERTQAYALDRIGLPDGVDHRPGELLAVDLQLDD